MIHFLLHRPLSRRTVSEEIDGHTHLFLLLFWYRSGIRQLRDRLPLFVFLEPLPDGREKTDDRVRHGSLEIFRVHVTFLERVPERVVSGEVHRPAVLLVPVNAEYRTRGRALGRKRRLLVPVESISVGVGTGAAVSPPRSAFEPEFRYGDEDGLDESEHAVVRDVALFAERLFDLAPHGIGRVEKVDFGVWVGRRHLPSRQARDHRVHEVSTLRIAKARKVELCESENFPLRALSPSRLSDKGRYYAYAPGPPHQIGSPRPSTAHPAPVDRDRADRSTAGSRPA